MTSVTSHGRPTTPLLHGGDLDAARRRYPRFRGAWLDLSTGINTRPYPLPVLAPEAWTRLPQASDEEALRVAAARRYGAADPAMVVAAPGTQALIQILPRLIGGSATTEVAVLGPTYAEHVHAWQREGFAAREVASLDDTGAARVVVVVNPDNPTGRLVGRSDLERRASDLERRGGMLVVDEAFVDPIEQASLVPRLPPAAIVLRSFGKTYGLAGLRLGFAIAAPKFAARLRDALGPWAVSGPALAIGRRALSDEAWLATTRARLERDTASLDALLHHSGWRVLGGTSLFRLAAHPDAAGIADNLGRHGIHVRRFPHQPTWARFGLPDARSDWDRLARAIGGDAPPHLDELGN